jgi:hypothetical protein
MALAVWFLAVAGKAVRFASQRTQFTGDSLVFSRLIPWKSVWTEATTGQKEHTPSPLARRILDFFLGRELGNIERGKQLDFGTSIICSVTRV